LESSPTGLSGPPGDVAEAVSGKGLIASPLSSRVSPAVSRKSPGNQGVSLREIGLPSIDQAGRFPRYKRKGFYRFSSPADFPFIVNGHKIFKVPAMVFEERQLFYPCPL